MNHIMSYEDRKAYHDCLQEQDIRGASEILHKNICIAYGCNPYAPPRKLSSIEEEGYKELAIRKTMKIMQNVMSAQQ